MRFENAYDLVENRIRKRSRSRKSFLILPLNPAVPCIRFVDVNLSFQINKNLYFYKIQLFVDVYKLFQASKFDTPRKEIRFPVCEDTAV